MSSHTVVNFKHTFRHKTWLNLFTDNKRLISCILLVSPSSPLFTDCLKAYSQHIHISQSENYAQDNHLEMSMHSVNNGDAVDSHKVLQGSLVRIIPILA
jgi:hypothetical protein